MSSSNDTRALSLTGSGRGVSTGCKDKDGNELFLGDKVRYRNDGPRTKPGYWNPEYEIVFDAPMFSLKHIGGGKDGQNHLFILRSGGLNGSLELIERAALSPEPTLKQTGDWLRDTAMNVMLATEVDEAIRILRAAIFTASEPITAREVTVTDPMVRALQDVIQSKMSFVVSYETAVVALLASLNTSGDKL